MTEQAPPPEPQQAPPPPAQERPDVVPYARFAEVQNEAAERRIALKEYTELFDGMDDETKAGWKQIISLAKSGDPQSVNLIAETFGLQPPEGPNYLTEERLNQIMEERESARQQEAAVEDVFRQAEALGYKRDTPGMAHLLGYATSGDGMSIEDAHAALEAERQALIQEYVEKKGKQSAVPDLPDSNNGEPPTERKTPRTMAEARAAAIERMNASRNR